MRSSPNPGLSSGSMSYTCHSHCLLLLPKKPKGRHRGKVYNPKKQAGASQRGLHDGS